MAYAEAAACLVVPAHDPFVTDAAASTSIGGAIRTFKAGPLGQRTVVNFSPWAVRHEPKETIALLFIRTTGRTIRRRRAEGR